MRLPPRNKRRQALFSALVERRVALRFSEKMRIFVFSSSGVV